MKYKDLIELYKLNNLNQEEKDRVEKDIERHVAISEYLFDTDELEELENLEEFDESYEMGEGNSKQKSKNAKSAENSMEDVDNKFMKKINHSIRMAFLKLGIITGGIVLAIVLGVIFILPKAVDNMYYNPNEVVGISSDGIKTTRINLDMAVYSELFLPGHYREDIIAEENGYGCYDINILQTISIDGNFSNISGKINKGKMTLYDPNFLTQPSGNAFVPNEIGIDSGYVGTGAAGSREDSLKQLDELNSDDYYIAYITLDKVMKYDELKKFCEDNEIPAEWCAICNENEEGYYLNDTIGFINSSSCGNYFFNKEKYPYLTQYSASDLQNNNGWLENDIMETRLDSLLKYMNNNEEYMKVVGRTDSIDYKGIRKSIQKYGINIYGITVICKKDEIINISKIDNIHYIYTRPFN